MQIQRTISPVDGSVLCERPLASAAELDATLERAVAAQCLWRSTSLADRAAICTRFCAAFEAHTAVIAGELSWQMGRPVRYAPNEVRGTLERARHMIAIAPEALADMNPGPKEGFGRFIRREPLGVVLTVAAWNYPYLIAVNNVDASDRYYSSGFGVDNIDIAAPGEATFTTVAPPENNVRFGKYDQFSGTSGASPPV